MLDPVDELEEATTKNLIIMKNPTSIQIVKGNQGLGISIVGGNDTPLVSVFLFLISYYIFIFTSCYNDVFLMF